MPLISSRSDPRVQEGRTVGEGTEERKERLSLSPFLFPYIPFQRCASLAGPEALQHRGEGGLHPEDPGLRPGQTAGHSVPQDPLRRHETLSRA